MSAPRVLGGACLVTLAIVGTGPARADDEGLPDVKIHAFVSQGALLSTGNNYLAMSKRGSLEFAEVGANLTSQLGDKLRVGLQLFAKDLGATGNYSMKADWFYLDYHWRDWLGFRAGRVKVPFGLYNETSDIDAARVFVLLPSSVYPETNRDYLLAQTGVELYGYLPSRAAGALEYDAYFGTIYLTTTSTAVKSIDVPYVAGARLIWETPLSGLRAGLSAQKIRLGFQYADPAMPMMTLPVNATVDLGVASLEYARGDLLVAAEASEWRAVIDEADLAAFPGTKHVTVSERAYGLVTYHARPWLWPGFYYSVYMPDEALATFTGPSGNMLHDWAGTLRFDITPNWIFKLEAHYQHGTAGLDPTLNGGVLPDMMTRDWALFLAKTTAFF